MKFINELFTSKETKEVLKKLAEIGDEILEEFNDSNYAETLLAWDLINREATSYILKESKAWKKIKVENNISSQHLVLRIIYSISKNRVCSGQHHIYRGTLGFVGSALFNIMKYALRELEKINDLSDEQVNEIIKEVLEEIKFMG